VGKAPQTISTYRTGLRRFCEYLAFRGLPPRTTRTTELPADIAESFVTALAQKGGRKATLFVYASAVKSWLKFLYRRRFGLRESSYELTVLGLSETLGRMEYRTEQIDRQLPKVIEHVLALPEPEPAPYSSRSVRSWRDGSLYRSARERQERGVTSRRLEWLRDRALLLTLWCTGAREHEVVGLNRADLDDGRADQALIVGKGGRERVIFFDQRTIAAVREYLEARGDTYRPLFLLRHNRGRSEPGPDGERWRLETQSVWLIVGKYAKAPGVLLPDPGLLDVLKGLRPHCGARSARAEHADCSTVNHRPPYPGAATRIVRTRAWGWANPRSGAAPP
jgi:site-specific recombinase XerD